MPSSNIERSDEITAKVFSVLYEEFPVPTNLFAETYVSPATCCSEFLGCDVLPKPSSLLPASRGLAQPATFDTKNSRLAPPHS